MWNFLGWDNASTYAEEVNKPIKSYLKAVTGAFLLIMSIYILIITISGISGINPALLKNEGYPALGRLVGGKWLGGLVAIAGMASSQARGLYLRSCKCVTFSPDA